MNNNNDDDDEKKIYIIANFLSNRYFFFIYVYVLPIVNFHYWQTNHGNGYHKTRNRNKYLMFAKMSLPILKKKSYKIFTSLY